jgi:addiction module RelE/StbE family toxin
MLKQIKYTQTFEKHFMRLPLSIKKKAVKKEQLFRENPQHPSLRLHKLSGKLSHYWSISVDRQYRIIFRYHNSNTIVFIDIGTHSIYG